MDYAHLPEFQAAGPQGSTTVFLLSRSQPLPLPIPAHTFFNQISLIVIFLFALRCQVSNSGSPTCQASTLPQGYIPSQVGGFPSLTWGLFRLFLPRNYCWLSSFKHSFLCEDTQCSDFSTITRSFLETPVPQSLSISVRSRKQGKHIGFMDGNLKAT